MLGLGILGVLPGQQPPPRRTEIPPRGTVLVTADTQSAEGPVRRLKGNASLETTDSWLGADEIEYNEESREAVARGNVHFRSFKTGEELWGDKVEYNVREETGRFYNIRGTSLPRIEPRPRLLTTTNPFQFQGRWAERLKDRYILYDGLITNCRIPKPWWTLSGPKFDIIPGSRALAYRSVFRVKRVPIFYAPFFFKSLESEPRKSGFLTPNLGNSSRRGKMIGAGYFWAINRSYDAAYRTQYFTQRGFAHTVDLRGKPRAGSEFSANVYGVNDRGLRLDGGERRKEGGFILAFDGFSDLGRGFHARGEVNYLSSLRFRQAFTESFNEAIFAEVHSTGFVEKHWSNYGLNLVFQRNENIQRVGEFNPGTQKFLPDDKITIRKLPQLEFQARDRQITERVLPVWVSLESSAGLVRRNQPLFQTRQYMERVDFRPRVMTAFRWKGFHLLPSFSVQGTHYGESFRDGRLVGENLNRLGREFTFELVAPPLERTFNGPGWLGDKVKHGIEPRVSFRHAGGYQDFERVIRFDETELFSNTTEAEISLTNRIFVKRGGEVQEAVSWQLWQRRYFDPDFGGAVIEGRRNIVASAVQMTPFAFLDRPRHYSPLVSVFRMSPRPGFGMEWRTDYDPLRSKIVNGGLTADVRHGIYFVSLGHNHVRSVPVDPSESNGYRGLSPSANQIRGLLGLGNENRRGWNAAFSAIYDYRAGNMQFATTQITYNTDCCGISVQYRRFSFGARNENQFRVSFSVANIGSFGTLKKQERIF